MCGHTYVIMYFDPRVFVFAWWSTSPHTPQNSLVYQSSHVSFTALNYFVSASKTYKLTGVNFLFISVMVVSNALFVIVTPYTTVLFFT